VTAGGGFVEHFRLETDGRFNETQYQLMSPEDAEALRNPDGEQGWGGWGWGGGNGPGTSYYPGGGVQPASPPVARGLFTPWSDSGEQRIFPWGGRPN
jgi:hypothetical protein